MLVRTIREHQNAFGPCFTKRLNRQYEVSEAEAKRLIKLGYVEPVADDDDLHADG